MDILVFDDIIMDHALTSDSFIEGCKALDDIGFVIYTDYYEDSIMDINSFVEAHVGPPGSGDKVKSAIDNTAKTTRDAAKIWDDATDAGGYVAKGAWDISVGSIGLVAKIIKFISSGIGKIFTMIANAIKWVGNLPRNIVNKIRGNIDLYITAPDLEYFYNKIFPDVEDFFALAHTLSEGDVWSTFIRKNLRIRDIVTMVPKFALSRMGVVNNDMDLYEGMKTLENRMVKHIKFKPSRIELSKPEVRDIYFGDSKSINFFDISGYQHQYNYYDGLNHLFKRLSTGADGSKEASVYGRLRDVQTALSQKFVASQKNNTFSQDLTEKDKLRVKDSIMMISRFSTLLGNLFRYVMTDLNTIKKNVTTILQKDGVTPATATPARKGSDKPDKLPKGKVEKP